MHDLTAKRTLVKSPPELWSEVSEVERLARHLGAFGEITITKLEPEHTVAWEGEGASGTVSIEPAGWGTKVTLRAQLEQAEVEEPVLEAELEEPPPAPDVEAIEVEEPEPPPRRGFFARLFARRTGSPVPADEELPVAEEPVVEEPPTEAPGPEEPPPGGPDGDASLHPEHAQAILDEALDALGAAHHRPFSRG
jgi:hypothetical protein